MRRQPSIRDELLRTPVEYDPPKRKDNLFIWTVFLLLLFGFGMVTWITIPLIFSRPEWPLSYRLLRKIHKLDEPQRFKVNAAPNGEFLGPERLYSRYNAMNAPTLRDFNRSLERAYLRNYPTSNDPVPYVTGWFTIMDSYELRETDFVPAGVVTLAVSTDFPKVLIEQVYSASAQDAPIIRRNLQTGRDINLRRTFDLTAVLHVTKLGDGRILLTVMPINYGGYEYTGSSGGFELQPPAVLNVSAGWPIVRGDRLETANQAYVDFRTHSGLSPVATARAGAGRAAPVVVGVDKPVEVNPLVVKPAAGSGPVAGPAASAPPVAKVAEAIKLSPVAAVASPSPSPFPVGTLASRNPLVLPAIPLDEPPRRVSSPPPVVSPTAPTRPSKPGVSLQPFLGGPATPPPAALAGSTAIPRAAWTQYAPGHVPGGGKNVRVNELAALGQRSVPGEPLYLTGQFVVRAVGENRVTGARNAVLRSGSDNNVRVIVEYPSDRALPAEGSEFSRDEQRPYQITDVRRVPDGTINVYAREITSLP